MSDLLAKLAAPFPPSQISWRVGPVNDKEKPTKGIALAYLDARDVQDRLDAVCGTGWQSRYPHAAAKTVCEIGIKIGDEWVWRSDGAGDTDMEAEKGSLSDAFKRAAVKWGIGRYLYDAKSPWVDVVKKGKSAVIADHEFAKLEKLLPGSKAETAKAEPTATPEPPVIAPAERQLTKPQARSEYTKMVEEIKQQQSLADLAQWGVRNKPRLDAMPTDWQLGLRTEYSDHKASLSKGIAA